MSADQWKYIHFQAVNDVGRRAFLPRCEVVSVSLTRDCLEGIRGERRLLLLLDALSLRWVHAAGQLLARRIALGAGVGK